MFKPKNVGTFWDKDSVSNPLYRNQLYKSSFGAAFFGLIILVTVLFLPAMTGWQGIFHDDQGMEEFPRYYFVAHNLQRGIIPLWDPQTWCGAIPFYARYYADTYYVLLWPFFLLANLNDLNQAYWFLILLPLYLHYLTGAIGMFVFLRRVLRCGYLSSFFGGAAYIFSPAFAYAYGWQQVVTVQAWLPWLLIIYVSAVDKWRFWKLPLAGIVLYFIVTGAAPSLWPFVLFLWGSVIIVVTIYRFNASRKKRELLKPFFIALAIVILGCGLSGVYLFSFFDGTKYTEEHIKLTADAALQETTGSLPPPFLAALFIPNLFDNITGTFMNSFNPSHNVAFWDANMSGGMAVFLLVLLGAISVFKIRTNTAEGKMIRLYTLAFIFLYIFAILCVLGRHTPFYRYVIGNLPGIGQLPRPIRYRFIQCFSAAVLLAVGLESLIMLKFPGIKTYLRRSVWGYIIFSFFVIAVCFIYPGASRKDILYNWSEIPVNTAGEYFPVGCSAGKYTAYYPVKKIKVMFDRESTGEIRYADTSAVLPYEGVLVKEYQVPAKGWYEFDVDIPPNKFVWIYQKSGDAGIGYKRCGENIDVYHYDDKEKIWVKHSYTNSFWFIEKKLGVVSSLISKLGEKGVLRRHIVFSLLYWLLLSAAFILGVYFLPPKQFGYFAGSIALLEFFIFCRLAFYYGMFNAYEGSNFIPHRFRVSRPMDHPILKRVLGSLAYVCDNTMTRIATDAPFHDNFVRMNSRFALMGYEMHPLEAMFKRAIESAYGQAVSWTYYFNNPHPSHIPFLSHFSVRYFMNNNPNEIFPGEKCTALAGESKSFVHINPNTLPRIYSLDKAAVSSDEEQLRQLTSGDLREAVYISYSCKAVPRIANLNIDNPPEVDVIPMIEAVSNEVNTDKQEGSSKYFNELQRINRISRVDMDNPNRIGVNIDVNKPAMLVSTEVWYPGWEAAVDDIPAEVYRVNYCQRGVWLEKGRHYVSFFFRPTAWYRGLKVSLGTLSLLLIFWVVIFIKRYFCRGSNASEAVK